MEHSKKLTVLLTPEIHAQLTELARIEDLSIGELIRRAVTEHYGLAGRSARLDAVAELAALELPVDTPARMKRESMRRI